MRLSESVRMMSVLRRLLAGIVGLDVALSTNPPFFGEWRGGRTTRPKGRIWCGKTSPKNKLVKGSGHGDFLGAVPGGQSLKQLAKLVEDTQARAPPRNDTDPFPDPPPLSSQGNRIRKRAGCDQ